MRKRISMILCMIFLILTLFSFDNVEARVADVSIKNIEMLEKTGSTDIINDASFSGMNINYNILFKEINDSVKYKITIINKGNEDIYINNKGQIGDSNYIVYDYIWDDNQNIIKANSEKTFELAITYRKQINSANLEKGKYVEAKNLVIKISDQKGNTLPVKNPNTDSNLSIFIIVFSLEILAVLAVTLYLIKNKKLNIRSLKNISKANKVTIGIFLIMVLGTIIGYSYCLDSTEIVLNSVVKVSKARLARSCSSDSYAIDHPYDNTKTMYEDRNDSFPLVAEGVTIPTGIDSNDYCLDWTLEFEKAQSEYEKAHPRKQMLSINEEEMYNVLSMATNSISVLSNESTIETLMDENVGISTFGFETPNTYSNLGERVEPKASVLTLDTKNLPRTYTYENINYELIYTSDVSDLQNGDVMLGIYIDSDDSNGLIIIGEDGGVLAPVDSSWLFGVLDRKSLIFGEQQLNILQGLGKDLDMIKQDAETDDSFQEIFDIQRIINKPKFQLLFKKNIQIGPMIIFNDFNLNNIDFSDTNSMSGMFAGSGIIRNLSNGCANWRLRGIKNWDTSSVKDMSGMFLAVAPLPINTGQKATMESVPESNIEIDEIKYLNTSNVEDMFLMFAGSFNDLNQINISNFDTSKVKDMSGMFAAGLNSVASLDLSKWNTARVEDMTATFTAGFNNTEYLNVSKWNTSNVKHMVGTFALALNNSQYFDISNWDVSNVKDISLMFAVGLNSLNSFDISRWNTGNVEFASGTFSNSLSSINKFNISNWNTSKIKSMIGMFANFQPELTSFNISNWDTSNVKYMQGMFANSLPNLTKFDISNWNTSSVKTMASMFENSLESLSEFNLANWDVSNVEDMELMFADSLYSANKLNLSNWNTTRVKSMGSMFENTFDGKNLKTTVESTPQLYINKFNFDNVTDCQFMFRNMPYTNVYVKDKKTQDYILNTLANDIPSFWTIDNIIIV